MNIVKLEILKILILEVGLLKMNDTIDTIFKAIREAGYIIILKEEFDDTVQKATQDRIKKINEENNKLITRLEENFITENELLKKSNQNLRREIDRLQKLVRTGRVGE